MHAGNIEDCETTLVPHVFLSSIAWEFNKNLYKMHRNFLST